MIYRLRYLALAAAMAAAGVGLSSSAHSAEEPTPRAAVTAVPAPSAPAAVVATTPRASPVCIPDWSDAGPIVRSEGLATMEKVGRLARDHASVEIVNGMLCKAEDRYVYRLTVRSSRGALRTMIVDARQPFGQ